MRSQELLIRSLELFIRSQELLTRSHELTNRFVFSYPCPCQPTQKGKQVYEYSRLLCK